MHTVDLLTAAIACAEDLGIRVREEWLDGANGGECEVAGQRWLFLDLAQTPQERLAVVAECLAAYSLELDSAVPPELKNVLQPRAAA